MSGGIQIRVTSYHYVLVPGDFVPLCWRICTIHIYIEENINETSWTIFFSEPDKTGVGEHHAATSSQEVPGNTRETPPGLGKVWRLSPSGDDYLEKWVVSLTINMMRQLSVCMCVIRQLVYISLCILAMLNAAQYLCSVCMGELMQFVYISLCI